MKKHLFLLFFSCISFGSFSQKEPGVISLYVSRNEMGREEIMEANPMYVILRNNTDTVSNQFYTDTIDFILEKIDPGLYEIVLLSYPERKPFHFRKVEVFEGTITNLTINLREYESYDYPDPPPGNARYDCEKDHILGHLDLFYGSNFSLHPDNPVKKEIGFNIGGGSVFSFSPHLGFGHLFGIRGSLARFSNDSSLVSLQDRTREKYSYFGLNYGVFLHFSTANQQRMGYGGCTLDMGINYVLPLYFRHHAQYGKNRISTQYIHQFTDVRLTVRLRYEFIGVFAEYRLSDFILGDFPELPVFRIGITLFAPVESY